MPNSPGMIRVATLNGFVDLVHDLGGDPEKILRDAGIALVTLGDEDTEIPFSKFLFALDRAAHVTGCEEFGLLLSDRQTSSVLGPLFDVVESAPDLRSALDQLCRIIPSHDTATTVGWYSAGEFASLSCLVLDQDIAGTEQHTDHAALFGVHLLRSLMGREFEPELVHLPRKRPKNAAIYAQLLGCSVFFDAAHFEIVFDSAWLDRPVLTANPNRHPLLVQNLETMLQMAPTDIVRQTKGCIWRQLQEGEVGLSITASRLGLTVRTLQRELAARNTSYRALLVEMRNDIANRLRHYSDLSLTEIASALGYSELSALSRMMRKNSAVS